jgi:hypothetical protein
MIIEKIVSMTKMAEVITAPAAKAERESKTKTTKVTPVHGTRQVNVSIACRFIKGVSDRTK